MASETPTNSLKRRIMIITADESIIEQLQSNTNAALFRSIILDSNGDSVELPRPVVQQTQPHRPPSPPKKTKGGSLTCVVCGSPANGYNFDAISCESCKAFFRRNALKDPASLECRRNQDCDITLESRRRCSSCRLIKCLSSGMKRDRLLTSDEKAAKRRRIEENRNLTQQTTNDTPINHRNVIPKPELSSPTLQNTFTNVLPSKESQTTLTSEELRRVEDIQLSYEQRIELAARAGLPWNPSVHTDTLVQHLNARSISAVRLLSFFKQIPEFNQLNVHDRFTLVKYNLMPLAILNCTLGYDEKHERIVETDTDAPMDPSILLKAHGQEIYDRVKKIFESFVRIAQYDHRIIQLALIILILTKGFSASEESSEPTLDDGLAVYRAQNYYTELLWKYLESTQGQGKAGQIFNDLVVHFMSWQSLQPQIRANIHNLLTPTEINELLPIMKSLLNVP